MTVFDTAKLLTDMLVPGLSKYFTKQLIDIKSIGISGLLDIPESLKKLFNSTDSNYLKELIKSSIGLKKRKANKKSKNIITFAESISTAGSSADKSNSDNDKIYFNMETIERNKEQTADEDENIADLLWEHLSTLAEDITQLVQIYTPIDTGLLISSFYYKTGAKSIELGFDLDKCPYASIVHEKHNVRHPNGGTDQFLYHAVVEAVRQFDFAKDINIEFIVNREELKVILNGENNNITELFNDNEYTSPFEDADMENKLAELNSLNFSSQEQFAAYVARYEKQREVLTGKKQKFTKNFLNGMNARSRLSFEQHKQADMHAFRSVDSNMFNHTEINDPRRLFAFLASAEMTFTKPTMFAAMKNTNI